MQHEKKIQRFKWLICIVLDEPTASIDPVEESAIYRRFTELSKGKTAVIITHRLGSARFADRIIVMNKGTIVEDGTHDELMKLDGYYKKMWTAQSEFYV